MHIFLYIHYPYFVCHCTEYKLLAINLCYRRKLHPTLRYSNS